MLIMLHVGVTRWYTNLLRLFDNVHTRQVMLCKLCLLIPVYSLQNGCNDLYESRLS